MTNTYILQQEQKKRRRIDRNKVRVAVNIGCRTGVVLAGIGFIGVFGGVEFGALMLGRRILIGILMLAIMAALIAGESATHVDLLWDEEEEDDDE